MSTVVRSGSGAAALAVLLLLALSTTASAQQTGTIVGTVTDRATQQPLVATQVYVEGLEIGALTDESGRFTLSNVPAGNVTVRVNRIGFAAASETVTVGAGARVTVDFQLAGQALALDEIVVTGTAGQARRRELGNTVSQISTADLTEPVRSIDGLLQGRATSMTVVPASGAMGAGATIRLRGVSSVTQSNQPVVYIDGVRQGTDAYPLNNSAGAEFWQSPQAQASPLNDLNPEDIERIEIVRGAAAATLYGTQASAGVIQIFTKRGAEGPARWTYQTNQSIDRVQKFGSSQRPYIGMDPFLRNAYNQQHNLSVSGGRGDVNYYLSGLFEDGQGVHPNDEQQRYALRGNLTAQPLNNLTIDWRTAYSNHDLGITHVGNNLYGLQFNAMRAKPGHPRNTVGSDDPEVIGRLLDSKISQVNNRFTTGVTATYAPTSNFTNRFTLGLDRTESLMEHRTPFGFILLDQGSLSEQRWTNQAITLDYVGSYDYRATSDLRLQLSWGGQNITTEESMIDGFGLGFPGPGEHTLSAAASRLVFGNSQRVIDAGVYGQVLFDLLDRYFLTVALRADGNSTFGDDFGIQTYPKANFSWVVSEESFWPEDWGVFRLRGAYGHAGRAPGAFDAVRTWSPLSFAGRTAFVPSNVGNANLGPERSQELELGFETALLDGRVGIDFTWYNQKTVDALFNVTQIPSRGFIGSQIENVGEIANRGIELTVDGQVLRTPSLSLDLGLSFTTHESEVLDAGGQTFYTIVEGQPIAVMRGTKITNPDAFEDPQFEQDAFYGPSHPTRILGMNAVLTLPRGVQLAARGEYQGGYYTNQSSQWAMVNRGAGAPGCDDIYGIIEYNGWATATEAQRGQVNAFNRARCFNDMLENDVWIEPADFFKIREVSVQVPVGFAVPMARNASFTLSASNIRLWTHADFSAFDPEMVWTRESIRTLAPGIAETTPAPMRFTAALRVNF